MEGQASPEETTAEAAMRMADSAEELSSIATNSEPPHISEKALSGEPGFIIATPLFEAELGPTADRREQGVKAVLTDAVDNTVIKQNLEPNSVEIWTGVDDKTMFRIKCQRPLLDLAVEDAVLQFNRLAKATGRHPIILSSVVGAPLEKHETNSLKKRYDLPDGFDEAGEAKEPKEKNAKLFHNRLRRFRREAGFTISLAADALSMDPQFYLDTELGIHPPLAEEQIIHLGDVFGLTDVKFTKLKTAAINTQE